VTYAAALADARDLKATLERHGVRCSIELVGGRGSDPWATPTKYLRMHHHTVSRYVRGGNMTPCLALVKTGRPDVIGPLCNGYGGYDLVYRIICMGLANHPGQGGPVVIDGVRIPEDSARGPTWGTEWEGGIQDWAAIPGMLEFMGRADNALAEWSGRPVTSQLEHSTWTTRKIDRLNFTRATGIALSRKWAGAGEDDMTPAQEKLLREVHADLGAVKFVVDLLWQTQTPGGIRYAMPTTGELVPPGTPGAKPVSDIWRWAREAAIAARGWVGDEPPSAGELEQMLADLKALHEAEPSPAPES
jgi:hypothetical protein